MKLKLAPRQSGNLIQESKGTMPSPRLIEANKLSLSFYFRVKNIPRVMYFYMKLFLAMKSCQTGRIILLIHGRGQTANQIDWVGHKTTLLFPQTRDALNNVGGFSRDLGRTEKFPQYLGFPNGRQNIIHICEQVWQDLHTSKGFAMISTLGGGQLINIPC